MSRVPTGPLLEDEEPVEIARAGLSSAPVVLTCEHASERLPEPFRWPEEDRWLVGTHWAYDLGAAELARELAAELRSAAVLSRFSRLLADPNRPETAADLFRTLAEQRPVHLNSAIDEDQRERRLALYRAYHAAVDREVAASTASVLLAVHTFTPVYEGRARQVEVGVLFDRETALAEALRSEIDRCGFRTGMNEPYSGKLGLMYSVDRHAERHGRRPIELEVRQDLSVDPAARARLVAAVARFLRTL